MSTIISPFLIYALANCKLFHPSKDFYGTNNVLYGLKYSLHCFSGFNSGFRVKGKKVCFFRADLTIYLQVKA
jgi:hypothetical protein